MIGGAGATAPDAPTIGTATSTGATTVSVTFSAPANNGGSAITGFTVTSSPGSVTGTGSSSPITVSGLTTGTAYTFTVTATNAIGTSPASSASNSATPEAPSLYAFTTVTLRPGSTNGPYGPTIGVARTAAGSPSWAPTYLNMSTPGIQLWTVPQTATYRIELAGASAVRQDYAPNNSGSDTYGRGARFTTDVPLTYNTVIKVLCGQLPANFNGYSDSYAGERSGAGQNFNGAGGATFIATSADVPIAAAGGGGSNRAGYLSNQTNINARTDFAATGNDGGPPNGPGTNGNGATTWNGADGSGGAGFYGDAFGPDGQAGTSSSRARAFVNGGTGGLLGNNSPNSPTAHGGFGGGGHGGWGGSGGGGGYSGGSTGTNDYSAGYGGGGGNYNAGTLVGSVVADRVGPGFVTITKL